MAERYEHARKALDETRAQEVQTRGERDRLAAEAKDLQNRLVANAAKVQALEAAFSDTQAELTRLHAAEAAAEADLARDRVSVAHLLAVLQRLDADEPPALALRPDDSLAAARGTMLLGSMLPPVYAQAASLATRLQDLVKTRNALEAKDRQSHAEALALQAARVDLDRLWTLRNRETADADAKLSDIHGVTEDIGRQAVDLKNLIDRITALRSEGGKSDGMTVVSQEKNDTGALKRGSLRQPVVGQMLPGDPAGPGLTPGASGPQGLWFEAAGGAQAVAPMDSEVVFAGAYQKFGQVLILEINGGYHLTLAGLGRIDVHIGDLLLAGEPVGILADSKVARLYLELRRNGQTVDPAPWMSAELRKAKGT